MSASDSFEQLRSAMEKAGIRYAVGGSWASTAFGEPRFTNDVDIVADFTQVNVVRFFVVLPETFYADAEEARNAIANGKSFNLIHVPSAFKFDIFPARAFALGLEELARAIHISGTGLSNAPVPFVTPEDILLAKLNWFRLGNEVSEVQWRDILGIVRGCAASLDREYLHRNAEKLAVGELLIRALTEL